MHHTVLLLLVFFFFLPIKMVAESTFFRHANSIPPLHPSLQSGPAMRNFSPGKNNPHVLYFFWGKNKRLIWGIMSNGPLVRNAHLLRNSGVMWNGI